MPILTAVAAALAAQCTVTCLTETIFAGWLGNRADAVMTKSTSLVQRIKKQFSDTQVPVNHDLQKAILSVHWMTTKVFAEKLRKEPNQVDAIKIVLHKCDERLKELSRENYRVDTVSLDAYAADSLILMEKIPETVEGLREKVIEFHINELRSICGERTTRIAE